MRAPLVFALFVGLSAFACQGAVTETPEPVPAPVTPRKQDAAPSLPPTAADATVASAPSDAAIPSDARSASEVRAADDGAAPVDPLARPLSVLFITLPKAIPDNGDKVTGALRVIEDHDGTLGAAVKDRPAAFVGAVGIDRRGNSSSSVYAQKPYGLELRDEQGMDAPAAILGFPKESDFVLHSCYSDKTCLRNALAYEIARAMAEGSGRWVPRTRWVEVYFQKDYEPDATKRVDYRGVYLLVEKIKRDKNRVNLPAPAASKADGDLSGGYIFSGEGDMGKPGRDFPDYKGGYRWVFRYPRPDVITAEQKSYLQGRLTAFEKLLAEDSAWKTKYPEALDEASFLDYFLLQEVTSNVDGFWKSWYFYKQPDAAGGRFVMGPPWDYDLAFGNVDYGRCYCTNNRRKGSARAPFGRVWQEVPAFVDAMKCRYLELRKPGGILDAARLDGLVAAWTKQLGEAKKRDAARWENIGIYVWPNNYVGATWEDEVTYLRYWVHKRLDWLDKNLDGSCPAGPASALIALVPMPPLKNVQRKSTFGIEALVYLDDDKPAPAGVDASKHGCP